MKEDEVSSHKEKIESKGAYSYDLHQAIRSVRYALASDDQSSVSSCLNALFDLCAPEIREAVKEEWNEIDKKYRDMLNRVRTAEYNATEWTHKGGGWKTNKDGSETYTILLGNGVWSPDDCKRIERRTRQDFIDGIWEKIYHERFRACIDCLDRHGELRKWREVEYGRV